MKDEDIVRTAWKHVESAKASTSLTKVKVTPVSQSKWFERNSLSLNWRPARKA